MLSISALYLSLIGLIHTNKYTSETNIIVLCYDKVHRFVSSVFTNNELGVRYLVTFDFLQWL